MGAVPSFPAEMESPPVDNLAEQIAAAPTITPGNDNPAEDASDCVDYAEELAARLQLLQRHEESGTVPRDQYLDNLTELRALLAAIDAYVVLPRVAVNHW